MRYSLKLRTKVQSQSDPPRTTPPLAIKRTVIGHHGRRFCSPLTRDLLASACDHIPALKGSWVLDVGCGKGEALRLVTSAFGCTGLGIDTNEEFLREGRAMLKEEGLQKKVEMRHCSAHDFECPVGVFRLAMCLGSSHALGGFEEAMATLRDWVGPGGWIIQGELTFVRTPVPAFLTAMGMAEDSCPHRLGVAAKVNEQNLTMWARIAVPSGTFEEYERSYLDRLEGYALSHPDDPDSASLMAYSRQRRYLYEEWGRTTLGFDLLVMQVPA
jgi:ubiquinone/menaquinone biosynthesis C-methylase UbiE